MSIEEQQKFLESLNEVGVTEAKLRRLNTAYAKTSRDKLLKVVEHLKDKGFVHITTITAVDMLEYYDIVYHLRNQGFALNLKVAVPKDDPKIPSVTGILAGANLYEREINDLMGVFPEGHPNPARIMLDYDWPEGLHPLRKEETIEGLREKADKAIGDLENE
ncbi:NADH-quinone oxidoreductase subunit C [Candidatus Bathyarchaeota archaeon]|jgi:NADH:ubiquinone oxidoreductase subunit C|nr:NADH-quinone oxidoreductase subunit C [Candidatus Bathyarchaeota archaeon]TFH19081.1 MAG: NADH-quinone oxidoreductase subunit C [Candidatus Bathyarchaeota archaeon]